MSDSTADRFIRVMAKLQAIDPGNEEPMRHQMRSMREAAFGIINAALQQAETLAWAANDIPVACTDAIAEAIASHTKAGQAGKEGS